MMQLEHNIITGIHLVEWQFCGKFTVKFSFSSVIEEANLAETSDRLTQLFSLGHDSVVHSAMVFSTSWKYLHCSSTLVLFLSLRVIHEFRRRIMVLLFLQIIKIKNANYFCLFLFFQFKKCILLIMLLQLSPFALFILLHPAQPLPPTFP